jgi:hypothetical protein
MRKKRSLTGSKTEGKDIRERERGKERSGSVVMDSAKYDADVVRVATNTVGLAGDWVCTGRYYIREGGDVWQFVQAKWKRRYFLLFSDCLLVCREKSAKKYDLLFLVWFSQLPSLPKPVPFRPPPSSPPPPLLPKDSIFWQVNDDPGSIVCSDLTWLNDVSLAIKALHATTASEALPPLRLEWNGLFSLSLSPLTSLFSQSLSPPLLFSSLCLPLLIW